MSGTVSAAEERRLVLITADLFLGSRLKGIGESAGYRVTTVPTPAGLAGADRAVVDLSSPGVELAAVIQSVGPDAGARIAAYAPHVRVDLLKAARKAGLEAVFTRGQLESALPRWLAEPSV